MGITPRITTREQLAPAIHAIKIEVYETARRERWAIAEIQQQTDIAITQFANLLESEAKFDWAELVRKLYLRGPSN